MHYFLLDGDNKIHFEVSISLELWVKVIKKSIFRGSGRKNFLFAKNQRFKTRLIVG